MHSEHLRNVQLSWVAFGWFVGLAIATGIALLLMASGVLSPADRLLSDASSAPDPRCYDDTLRRLSLTHAPLAPRLPGKRYR